MESEFDYIKEYYNVPADEGVKVRFESKPGVITGSLGAHILVKLDGESESRPYHPTWHMEYVDNTEAAGALDPSDQMGFETDRG